MKNRNITFTTIILFALGSFALSPVAQARQQSEDRGNGNSAAEDVDALNLGTTGSDNTAHGRSSLFSNTTGSSNTADGFQALYSNTIGEKNTANGTFALLNNTEGDSNTANGFQALFTNNAGIFNTATGREALFANTTGGANTAIGDFALHNNSSGSDNVALGYAAGFYATGNFNVYIGQGMQGVAGESHHTYIRNVNTTSVSGGDSDFVTVDLTTGLLGHASSSRRYKEDIKSMDDASEALFALKPVTFRYKKQIDQSQSLQYGLVAEDVAQVDPDLAIRDAKGQIENVRYSSINAMLLNEFLKEHKKIEEQEATITELKRDSQMVSARQQKEIQILTAQVEEQAAQIQKVSDQLEMNKPVTKVVLNNP
jgi:Chaperone of endosialidase